MRKTAAFLLVLLVLCGIAPIVRPAQAGAIVTTSLTGTIYGNIRWYHGRIVRFTLRDKGWPNALRDIVIRPDTHIYMSGYKSERLSPNVLHKGEEVRCQGGMTTFFDRLVAQRIIILHR